MKLPTEAYPEARENAVHDMEDELNVYLSKRNFREKLDVVIEYQESALKDELLKIFETSTPESLLNDTWVTEKTVEGILNDIIIDNSL
jgi:hypothetical protein